MNIQNHKMNIENQNSILGTILLTLGTFSGGLTLTDLDLYLSIGLKFVSFVSFMCYLLINQDAIKKGWVKFKNKFKTQ